MTEFKNTVIKMFFGFIILALMLCANTVLFAYLVAPGFFDLTQYKTLYLFFVSILHWVRDNWAVLEFSGAYVIIAGQPAVPFLLYKVFGSSIATFG